MNYTAIYTKKAVLSSKAVSKAETVNMCKIKVKYIIHGVMIYDESVFKSKGA